MGLLSLVITNIYAAIKGEKAIGSILSAVPGGQDYAKCAVVYGSGPMGNKRKRPDSAPPLL